MFSSEWKTSTRRGYAGRKKQNRLSAGRGRMIKLLLPTLLFIGLTNVGFASAVAAGYNLNSLCNANKKSEIKSVCINNFQVQKEEYRKTYNGFYRKVISERERIDNFTDFINNIEESERLWEKYIIRECSAEASLKKQYSGDYLFTYESCMAHHYVNKIKYYKFFKLD